VNEEALAHWGAVAPKTNKTFLNMGYCVSMCNQEKLNEQFKTLSCSWFVYLTYIIS